MLSPDALPLDDKNKQALQEVIAREPLALIEYWSIDPDYDGTTFRSKWQDYRENTFNDDDQYRVSTSAQITVPKLKGKKRKNWPEQQSLKNTNLKIKMIERLEDK